ACVGERLVRVAEARRQEEAGHSHAPPPRRRLRWPASTTCGRARTVRPSPASPSSPPTPRRAPQADAAAARDSAEACDCATPAAKCGKDSSPQTWVSPRSRAAVLWYNDCMVLQIGIAIGVGFYIGHGA